VRGCTLTSKIWFGRVEVRNRSRLSTSTISRARRGLGTGRRVPQRAASDGRSNRGLTGNCVAVGQRYGTGVGETAPLGRRLFDSVER